MAFYLRIIQFLALISLAAWLIFGMPIPKNKLDTVLSNGLINVVTTASPTTYEIEKNQQRGFEFELVSLFAESLGIKARFMTPTQFQDIFTDVASEKVDFAAAGLSITSERKKSLLFTPPYYQVTQQLIYHHRTRRPRNISYLKSPFFEVLAESSHAENLNKLNTEHPQLSWNTSDEQTVEELMRLVNSGLLDYTVADSNQLQLIQGRYPKLSAAFDLSNPEDIAWAFPKGEDLSLYNKAVEFLNGIEESGTLEQLQDKYFGYAGTLNYVGRCTYLRHIRDRLPALKPFFMKAAEKYSFNWQLLAAIAYQESHWNNDAVSPTGVRGIMMLTQATAKHINVADRRDPKQSIFGGAYYLSTRIKRVPERIPEPDRTWMAMAAYNIGFGHLEDARVLTQRQGADSDRWIDVKKRLPLLSKKEWYKKTKYGYARGKEPVTYVENIRNYYDILQRLDRSELTLDNEEPTEKALNITLPAL